MVVSLKSSDDSKCRRRRDDLHNGRGAKRVLLCRAGVLRHEWPLHVKTRNSDDTQTLQPSLSASSNPTLAAPFSLHYTF